MPPFLFEGKSDGLGVKGQLRVVVVVIDKVPPFWNYYSDESSCFLK